MNETFTRNSHCHFCGQAYAKAQPWPRECSHCHNISYLNPLPVAVVVVPVDEGGVVLVRRAIQPRLGQLALPGGFINYGESWQQAGAREVFEETGLHIAAEAIEHIATHSAPDSTVLIFGRSTNIAMKALDTIVLSREISAETSEVIVTTIALELAFPLHSQVLKSVLGE
jgi:ADP-ribose pyrophosphatase YjhB (NUDIX family)